MIAYSSSEVARKLGITAAALSKYIKAGKVPIPKTVQIGRLKVQSWSEQDLERLRKLLPKIANGRKTRYKKKQLATSNEQLATAKPKTKPRTKKQPQLRAAHHAPGSSTVQHRQSHKKK